MIIKEKALVRRLILACQTVAAKGYGDYGNAQEFLDQAEKAVFDVASVEMRSTVERVFSSRQSRGLAANAAEARGNEHAAINARRFMEHS